MAATCDGSGLSCLGADYCSLPYLAPHYLPALELLPLRDLVSVHRAQFVLLHPPPAAACESGRLGLAVFDVAAGVIAAGPEFDGLGFVGQFRSW